MIRVGEKIENRFFSFLDEKYIEKKKEKKENRSTFSFAFIPHSHGKERIKVIELG